MMYMGMSMITNYIGQLVLLRTSALTMARAVVILKTRGTGEGTTSKRDALKPWRLPKQLINSLSHETSQHHRIPLYDASELHSLSSSAKIFRAEEDLNLDVFFKHYWYNGYQKRDKACLLAAWNAFVQNVKNFGRERWL